MRESVVAAAFASSCARARAVTGPPLLDKAAMCAHKIGDMPEVPISSALLATRRSECVSSRRVRASPRKVAANGPMRASQKHVDRQKFFCGGGLSRARSASTHTHSDESALWQFAFGVPRTSLATPSPSFSLLRARVTTVFVSLAAAPTRADRHDHRRSASCSSRRSPSSTSPVPTRCSRRCRTRACISSGRRREPVIAGGGLVMTPTTTFAECPQLDVLCVPGGGGMNALLDRRGDARLPAAAGRRRALRDLGLHRRAGARRRRPAQGQARRDALDVDGVPRRPSARSRSRSAWWSTATSSPAAASPPASTSA